MNGIVMAASLGTSGLHMNQLNKGRNLKAESVVDEQLTMIKANRNINSD